jgi:hypothetical protein
MAQNRDATLQPKGFQVISGPVTQALTVPSGASRCLIKTEAQSVRWKDDTGLAGATAVSATEGMLIDVGDEFWYTGQLRALRFNQTAATAVLSVSYYA